MELAGSLWRIFYNDAAPTALESFKR